MAYFAQLLQSSLQVFLVLQVDGRSLESCILLSTSTLPVCEQISEPDPTMSAHPLEGNVTLVQQLDDSRTTDTQELRGLLRGQRGGLGGDRHRQALPKRLHHMPKHPVDLCRHFNPIICRSSRQEILRLWRLAACLLVRPQEVVDLCDPACCLWQVGLFPQPGRSHRTPLRNQRNTLRLLRPVRTERTVWYHNGPARAVARTW